MSSLTVSDLQAAGDLVVNAGDAKGGRVNIGLQSVKSGGLMQPNTSAETRRSVNSIQGQWLYLSRATTAVEKRRSRKKNSQRLPEGLLFTYKSKVKPEQI